MTIEPGRLSRWAGAIALVLTIWFGGLSLVTLVAEPSETMIVFGPSRMTLNAALATDAYLLDAGGFFLVVRSARKGVVRDLYANGALLVWPAIDGGCISLPRFPA
jgi:hypothetical protein